MFEPSPYDRRALLMPVESPALGVTKHVHIYLPPEHAAGAERFPVLYLLRGHEREWVNMAEDDSRGGENVIDVVERLRASGAIGPLILVMPGMASDNNAVPGMLTDFRQPELAAPAPGIGSGQFQRFFFTDLIPTIDAKLRTIPPARAIAGFSLGGYMAAKAAALRPDMFVSVGLYDASIPYTSDYGAAARDGDAIFAQPMFDPALGLPRDREHLADQSPLVLLMRADPQHVRRISWAVQYGPEHIEPWGSNFYRGEHMLRALASLGVSNAAPTAALLDGQHTWRCADRHIEQTLPIHWGALREVRSEK